ncbi:MAG TPA: hypothetical protein VF492_10605 [Verrucomicrobiae bacterium]
MPAARRSTKLSDLITGPASARPSIAIVKSEVVAVLLAAKKSVVVRAKVE